MQSDDREVSESYLWPSPLPQLGSWDGGIRVFALAGQKWKRILILKIGWTKINKQTNRKPQKLTFLGILNKMVAPLLNMELPINFSCLSLFSFQFLKVRHNYVQ